MKITKQQLKEQFSQTRLEKFVLRDILEDAKDYSGSFIERVKARLSDISKGCATGTVSKLIYHSDCLKFFVKFIDDISELVIDLEADTGLLLNKRGLPLYTFYAWLTYEETAYKISNFIEEKSEQKEVDLE
ncbi:MAG: hypothetical protein FWG57_09105 [Endomicrobia bacterium]|nr:hypothetical protein [Endomicrobiia bacterium]